MKNLYIPKGKTLHYETLYCQNIVNDGTLIVDGTLHARSISGKGILKAGTVSVRHVAEMDIECATMNGETMAAERVCAAEIVLSGSATVSCYLEAEYVEVPKLTMAKHNIGTLKADDVITLPEKKRGIVGTLVAGFFRRLWLSVIHRIPVDAPYVQVAAPHRKAPIRSRNSRSRSGPAIFSLSPLPSQWIWTWKRISSSSGSRPCTVS